MQISYRILMAVVEASHGRLISNRQPRNPRNPHAYIYNDKELCPNMVGIERSLEASQMLESLSPFPGFGDFTIPGSTPGFEIPNIFHSPSSISKPFNQREILSECSAKGSTI
jgi:hypothetical protein